MRPLVLQNAVLCVPFLHGWQGGGEQQIQEFVRRAHEANASPGAHSEAPGRISGAGHQQRPQPENRDSQLMLNSPRGSLPEKVDANSKTMLGGRSDFQMFLFSVWVWGKGRCPRRWPAGSAFIEN